MSLMLVTLQGWWTGRRGAGPCREGNGAKPLLAAQRTFDFHQVLTAALV